MSDTPDEAQDLPTGEPTAPTSPTSPTAPTVPPADVDHGTLPRRVAGLVRRRAWDYLTPMGLVAVLGALASVLMTLINAWTSPSMLRDGAFVHESMPTALLVAAGVVVVVLAALTARATLVVALYAAGDLLGHRVDAPGARAEVRRRRGLWATWATLLLLWAAVTAIGVPVLLVLTGWLLAAAALLVSLAVTELLARWVVVAVVHGVGLGAAARRMRHLRRLVRPDDDVGFRKPAGLFLLLVTVPAAAASWGVGLGTDRLDAPVAEALELGATAALAVPVPVLLVAAMTCVHLRITFVLGEFRAASFEPLAWAGVDRAAVAVPAAAPADGPASGAAPVRASSRAVLERAVAATLALLVAPAGHLLLVATNPTPAIEPVVLRFADDHAAPAPVAVGDDVLLVVPRGLSWCDLDDTRCRVESLGDLPGTESFEVVGATADPDGQGLAVLARAVVCEPGEDGEDDCALQQLLVTCSGADCFGDEASASRSVAVTGDVANGENGAIAAHEGRYALVARFPVEGPASDGLMLRFCASASCPEPDSYDLGDTQGNDLVRAQYAADGRLWVVRTDFANERVRAWSADPGATTLTYAFDLDLPMVEAGVWEWPQENMALRLAVRDDGTPVLLHRDPGTDELILTSCDDALCAERTTTTLPVAPVEARAADLVVDGTGRPVIATAGRTFVRMHSCTDRSCTGMRTALISDGQTLGYGFGEPEPDPFMTLDSHGRPVLALEETIPNPDDPWPGYWIINRTLWCQEARCGL